MALLIVISCSYSVVPTVIKSFSLCRTVCSTIIYIYIYNISKCMRVYFYFIPIPL